MLTFLALASNKGFVVDSYEDNAVGRLEKNAINQSISKFSFTLRI